MRSIAVQRRRPNGRRQSVADAVAAAIVAVGGLVLAGAVTAGPQDAPDAATGTVGVHGPAYDGTEEGPRGSALRHLLWHSRLTGPAGPVYGHPPRQAGRSGLHPPHPLRPAHTVGRSPVGRSLCQSATGSRTASGSWSTPVRATCAYHRALDLGIRARVSKSTYTAPNRLL